MLDHLAAALGEPQLVSTADGAAPLEGVALFQADGGWHLVTLGLGVELSLRIPDRDEPWWAVGLLEDLATYVVDTGNAIEPGDTVPLHGPLTPGSVLTALLASVDPKIPTREGAVVVRLTGVSDAELELARDWDVERFVELLGDVQTDPAREDRAEALAPSVRDAAGREGSSTGAAFVGELAVHIDGELVVVEVPAIAVASLRRGLAGRIPFGRSFWLQGPNVAVELVPTEVPATDRRKDVVRLGLSAHAARALADRLEPRRGEVTVHDLPGLVVRVVPTLVFDDAGQVVEEIG